MFPGRGVLGGVWPRCGCDEWGRKEHSKARTSHGFWFRGVDTTCLVFMGHPRLTVQSCAIHFHDGWGSEWGLFG